MSEWDAFPVAEGGGTDRLRITVRPQSPHAAAISSVESGGNYRAVGPTTRNGDRAVGKYQVMGRNVPEWTEEVLGRRMTPLQFLASPEAQDQVFNAKFGSYVDKYGPDGAARAWFAGEGGMNDPSRKDILGTSVADYSRKFNAAGGSRATAAAPQSASWDAFPVAESAPQPSAEAPKAAGSTKPDIGALQSFLTGAEQGLTANFGDELRGANAAAGLPPAVQMATKAIGPLGAMAQPVVGLARLGMEYLTGGDEAAKRYAGARDDFRELVKTAEAQHPVASIAGNVAGAVALPGGAMLQAATLPARMARGAAVGAGYGGLAGAGEGTDTASRLTGGAIGAATGAGVGAVAPPLVEGAIQAGRAVTRPVANAVRGIFNPDGEGARRVGVAIERDVRADPQAVSRLTPQEFASTPSARVMDMGGDATRALGRSAGNTSPEARGILNRTIDERFEEQAPRIATWLRNTFHYPNAQAQQDAIESAAKTVNSARYGQAFRDGRVGVWDQEIAELSQAPLMQDAIKAATKQAQNRSAPDVSQGAAISARWVNNGKPTLEFFDLVKRQLDQEINVAKRAGRTEDVMEATKIKNVLVQKLDDAVPSYSAARSGAAHFFGAENALEAGQNFVGASQRYGVPQARAALGKMSPEERQLFQDGYVSRLVETIEKKGDRRNVVNQIGQSKAAREELQIALGPQRAAELEATLRVEGLMDLARGAVQGNSTTARQLVELGLAGGVGGVGYLSSDPSAVMNAALVWGAARGHRAIDSRVAQRVANMLTSDDPRVLLRGIQMVARSNGIMDQLRQVDVRLARVGSQQTSVPAMQLPAPGRAEGEPEIPRPPGQ